MAQAHDAATTEGQHLGGVGEDDAPAAGLNGSSGVIGTGDGDGVGLGEDLGELGVMVDLTPGDAAVAGDGVGDRPEGCWLRAQTCTAPSAPSTRTDSYRLARSSARSREETTEPSTSRPSLGEALRVQVAPPSSE